MAVACWMAGSAAQSPVGTQGAGAATAPAPAAAPAAPAASAGARFLEACNLALQQGVTDLGCQGPLYRNELERLKREALATQNPQLLSLVGDAYGSARSGVADVGQSYRWYLMAAVRGDLRAMQRLAEMNQRGAGAPQDKVKALGYARLAQRLSVPGGPAAGQELEQTIDALGTEMAAEEIALAERFAAELQAQVLHAASPEVPAGTAGSAGTAPVTRAPLPGTGLPGLPHDRAGGQLPQAVPGMRLPGTPGSP